MVDDGETNFLQTLALHGRDRVFVELDVPTNVCPDIVFFVKSEEYRVVMYNVRPDTPINLLVNMCRMEDCSMNGNFLWYLRVMDK